MNCKAVDSLIEAVSMAKVGQKMNFGNTIRPTNFQGCDFSGFQQVIPCFGADFQGRTHLLNRHDIRVVLEHEPERVFA